MIPIYVEYGGGKNLFLALFSHRGDKIKPSQSVDDDFVFRPTKIFSTSHAPIHTT